MVLLSHHFLNPGGLAALLALIPFLLLYLIRPKPRHERVPSLLFLIRDRGKSNLNSFLRTFLKDLLFLLQLLTLLALAAAAARPYVNVPRSALVEQTILVIDASASTQPVFKEVVKEAKERLGKENTIIILKARPALIGERLSASKAEALLDRLEPTDTVTPLTEALQMAGPYAGKGSRIVVISDFRVTSGDPDYETVADSLEGQGALLEYVPVGAPLKNVGITDLYVGPSTSSVWVKNFNDRPVEATLRISDAEEKLLLAKGETREVKFSTPAGVTELRILEEDGLAADNVAWTSAPEKTRVRVLIITNDEERVRRSNFLKALEVISRNFPIQFDVEYGEPPTLPRFNHDVYVLMKTNLNFILPGHVKELKELVSKGASLVVFPQENLFSLDWLDLLPVEAAEESGGGRAAITPADLETLTRDIQFGQASSYDRVKKKRDAMIIAKAEADPIILLRRQGKGFVLYYGLDDEQSSFSRDPTYPVFWRRTLDLLSQRPSLAKLNVRTGSVIALPQPVTVVTPRGKEKASILSLDHAGLYRFPDRTVAANLLSDVESDVTKTVNASRRGEDGGGAAEERAPKELTRHFIVAALLLLLIEVLYVKYRGDL